MSVFDGLSSRRGLARRIESLYDMLGTLGNTGNTFYVCSVTGSDTVGYGDKPATPVATLTYALSLCTANKGDIIVCMPGHTEVYGASGSEMPIVVNKAGVRIVGVGRGADRPTFTTTASTDASIVMSAAGCSFQNCLFVFTGIDAVVAGITADAADLGFFDCEFRTNSGTAGCVSGITLGGTTACDRFRFERCRFTGPATNTGTTTTAQITITAGVDYFIHDCYFTGKCTQNITNGAAVLRGHIHNNCFVTATGTKSINMHASSTPFITNNRMNVPSGTAPIVAAAGFVAGNVYSAAAGVTAGTASTI